MPEHEITVDESVGPDFACRAFCSCGWAQDGWTHADDMSDWDEDEPWPAIAQALCESEAEGAWHMHEQDAPPPNLDAFLALRHPEVDRLGFAC